MHSMKFYQRFTNLEIGTDEAHNRFMIRMLYNLFPKYPIVQHRLFKSSRTDDNKSRLVRENCPE